MSIGMVFAQLIQLDDTCHTVSCVTLQAAKLLRGLSGLVRGYRGLVGGNFYLECSIEYIEK